MLLGFNLFLQAVLHIWQKSLLHIKIQGGCTKFVRFNGIIQTPNHSWTTIANWEGKSHMFVFELIHSSVFCFFLNGPRSSSCRNGSHLQVSLHFHWDFFFFIFHEKKKVFLDFSWCYCLLDWIPRGRLRSLGWVARMSVDGSMGPEGSVSCWHMTTVLRMWRGQNRFSAAHIFHLNYWADHCTWHFVFKLIFHIKSNSVTHSFNPTPVLQGHFWDFIDSLSLKILI